MFKLVQSGHRHLFECNLFSLRYRRKNCSFGVKQQSLTHSKIVIRLWFALWFSKPFKFRNTILYIYKHVQWKQCFLPHFPYYPSLWTRGWSWKSDFFSAHILFLPRTYLPKRSWDLAWAKLSTNVLAPLGYKSNTLHAEINYTHPISSYILYLRIPNNWN